jgi:hypothetical protein
MYKRIQIPDEETDNYQTWIEVCIEVAEATDMVEGVVIGPSKVRFLFDREARVTPVLLRRNIQLQFDRSDLTDTSLGDEDKDYTGPERSDYQLEYHENTHEFITDNTI